jgi:hypothetical protein
MLVPSFCYKVSNEVDFASIAQFFCYEVSGEVSGKSIFIFDRTVFFFNKEKSDNMFCCDEAKFRDLRSKSTHVTHASRKLGES